MPAKPKQVYSDRLRQYFQEMGEKEFIETFFSIIDKNRQEIPFKFNDVQQMIYKTASLLNIILKYRKPGVSVLIQCLFLARCLIFKNRNCVMLSYDKDATQRMLDRTDWTLKHLPFLSKKDFDTDNKNEFKITATNSKLYIGVAGSKAFGRGDDVTDVHLSELAWWEETAAVTGLLEALTTDHQVFIESTANGPSNLYAQIYRKAKNPNSGWTPHFFPWWIDSTLEADVPKDFQHNEEEKELIAAYPKITSRKLMWRRKKLASMIEPELFPQEYPGNEREAFVVLGDCIFNKRALAKYELSASDAVHVGHLISVAGSRPRFEHLPGGNLKVWKQPEPGRKYIVIGDASDPEGRTSKNPEEDPACGQVIDYETMEQVAVWHGQIEGYEFGRVLDALGTYYNTALMVVERNSAGIAALNHLRTVSYPNLYKMQTVQKETIEETEALGWITNVVTRPLIIEALKDAISQHAYILHDPDSVAELMTFVRNKKTGKVEASSGSHDDRVMTLAIGAYVRSINPDFSQPRDEGYLDRTGLREQMVPVTLITPGSGGY